MKNSLKIGIVLVALAVAVIGSGYVYAYFSDQQTASNNVFTAGTLALQVGSSVVCTDNISASNLAPGQMASVAGWAVQNTGNVNGNLSIGIPSITNNENGVNGPEIAAGESPTNTVGDLGANLVVACWIDVNGNGVCDSGDYYLPSAGGNAVTVGSTGIPAAANATLNSFVGKTWSNVSTFKGNGNIGTFRMTYSLPAATSNVVQGDSCTFPIVFMLNQSI